MGYVWMHFRWPNFGELEIRNMRVELPAQPFYILCAYSYSASNKHIQNDVFVFIFLDKW